METNIESIDTLVKKYEAAKAKAKEAQAVVTQAKNDLAGRLKQLNKELGLDTTATTTRTTTGRGNPLPESNAHCVLRAFKNSTTDETASEQSSVSEASGVLGAHLSQIINKLVGDGMLDRDRKGRGAKIKITAAGTAALKELDGKQ